MRQFDVCRNEGRGAADRPYILVLQSDLLSDLGTRVVAPLVASTAYRSFQALTPAFAVEGKEVFLSVLEIATVPAGILGPVVGNLGEERYRILSALDLLFTGV